MRPRHKKNLTGQKCNNRSNSTPPKPPLSLVSSSRNGMVTRPLPVLPDGSQGGGEVEVLTHGARPPRPPDPRRRGSAQAEACRRRRRHLIRPPQPQPPLELGPLRRRGRGGGSHSRREMVRPGSAARARTLGSIASRIWTRAVEGRRKHIYR